MIQFGKTYDYYVSFIIFIKLLFIITAIITLGLKLKIKNTKNTNSSNLVNTYNILTKWKKIFELIFIISLAFICIIVFCPFYGDVVFIDRHTRILLFLYGFIIILQQFGIFE
jgi:hypothetical protein